MSGSYVFTGVKFDFCCRFGVVESSLGLALTERDCLILILLVFGDPILCIIFRFVSLICYCCLFGFGVNTVDVLDIAC